MSLIKSIGCAALLGLLSMGASAQQQPLLQLQGQPYFGGEVTMHVTAPNDIGQPVLLALGLIPLPLDAPAHTSKGPFYIGHLTSVLALGVIAGNGRLDVPFTMPAPIPGAVGIPLALQAFINPQLSNPATLSLDEPYLLHANEIIIEHPLPSDAAQFGDTTAAGDFNDDGIMDVAVGAWFETVDGIAKAGRAYIMWGPDFQLFTVLSPAQPTYLLRFGEGLVVADFDGDGIDDLGVGEGVGGDPPIAGAHGHIYVFRGGSLFSTSPWISIVSAGTGQEAAVFGRIMKSADINGDDLTDLVVLAPDATVQGKTRAGRVEVFFGPTYGQATLIENPEPKVNDFFGSRVALGDATGDGISDIIEASGRATIGTITQAGRIHVYDGPTQALLATIDNPEPAKNDRFGEGLMAADLDADGVVEVIAADVKKNFYIVWQPLAPASISIWPKPPTPNPTAAATSFGYFFASMDANRDGLTDIVVADPFEGDATSCGGVLSAGGAFYAFLAPHYATALRYASTPAICNEASFWNLIAADTNGDGYADIVAGNAGADVNGFQNVGRVVIVR